MNAGPTVFERDELMLLRRHVDDRLVEAVAVLFDDSYYRMQSGLTSASRCEALEHFLEVGWRDGLDPHPLFDTRFYIEAQPEVAASGENPLLHYLSEGAKAGADPSPYFDTDYYYSQHASVTPDTANALVHYVEQGPLGRSCNPNPLFGNGYYLGTNPDLRGTGMVPLVHFLRQGRLEGRISSQTHARLMHALGGRPSLRRGRAHDGSILFFMRGSTGADSVLAARDVLVREYSSLSTRIVLLRRPPGLRGTELGPGTVIVEDHEPSDDLCRASSLRFLTLSLLSDPPCLAIGDVIELLQGARDADTHVYFLVLSEEAFPADLGYAARRAARIVFSSRGLFQRFNGPSGPYPANSVVRAFEPESVAEFLRATLDLAARDGALAAVASRAQRRTEAPTRRVLVPCTDWAVSGVNTALEAVGQELIRRGWDLQIVFTRDRGLVEQSLGPAGLPELPHRWLRRRRPGVDGMWEALIAETEAEAPCIVFTGYDFYANSVVPALTNDVGAVMWVQADDGDYYEQAYRLGRYCNAIVCVSSRTRDQVASINPALADRAHVIHNTSVEDADVLPRGRRDSSERLRIVYTGRLVQYQKRILDFVPLADELEALGVDFTIDLIGTAPPHDEAATLLPQRAARHLERGNMRLLGRLSHPEVLAELRAGDLFVLLSDFEGLPLSLVEAMASGCVPVVAEMQSGISEVLVPDENGLIVRGRDYASWARTIRDLWRDGARLTAMAERAQQTIRSSFTVERIGEQFDALFSAVAEEIAAGFERPPALTWGERRAPFGDVLPPPTMYRAVQVAGLG